MSYYITDVLVLNNFYVSVFFNLRLRLINYSHCVQGIVLYSQFVCLRVVFFYYGIVKQYNKKKVFKFTYAECMI